ncbi:hypothetical protein RIF29_32719 [Crotalaria pallida]|uniref:Disease resistance RPP13-like protein 1 n=1 Tax=Crotalaria pallida TaxID=3830 RepID=A0AAN9EKQ6_CROPI
MALELVGGALLNAVFDTLLERMSSPEVVNFFMKEKISNQLLKNLKVSLLSVTAVLNDAEEKHMTNASVKEWRNELQDLAFDADDMLDAIFIHARIAANQVHTIKSAPLKHNIQAILERFEFIIKQKCVLNLEVGRNLMLPKKIPSSSLIEACDVCGRDDEKDALLKMVLSDASNDSSIAVIPIVGMGGIGKTTLAQIIYNDSRVETEFDLRAWIHVSEEFDVCKITKTLLEVVSSSCSHDIKDLNSLQLNLKMSLAEKKFLFVFDDVWNENYISWDSMRSPFKHGAQGSKIIVTTRSMRVASIMQTASPCTLGELSDKDCWNLFSKHAFGSGDSIVDPKRERIGREIVQKCKGLPLGVKTLAGLLRSKSNKQEWLKVLNSEIWDLKDHESNVLPALRLSYHFLPSHLKRCFAYCALFPKNYEFEKEKLILLWMAEDLVQQSTRNDRIEDVGDEYFSELVSRTFFQQSTRDKSRFVMHHLVNDLAQFVSGKFLVRLDGKRCNMAEERTRYLSHIIAHPPVTVDSVRKATRLRTLLQIRLVGGSTSPHLYDGISHELLMGLRCLRVLSMVGASIYTLPGSIGELKHLRYLDFSGTEIYELPESVSELYNLQTLKVAGCCNLDKLPSLMSCLVDLRYLDISGIFLRRMPLDMSKLSNLQMLSDYFIGVEYGCSIGQLGSLSVLHGSLFIHNLKLVVNCKDSEEAKLKEKIFLRKLILDWSGNGNTDNSQHEKDVLDSLQPHTNLKELVIYNYPGTGFPKWLGGYSLCNLVALELKGCKYCYQLPPLGQLPCLKELSIIKFDLLESVSSEFYGNGAYSSHVAIEYFPALQIMRFEHMPMWDKWLPDADNSDHTAFRRLRELHIESCPSLKGELPAALPSLKILTIRDCKKLLCSLPISPVLRSLIIQNCGDLDLLATAPECYQSLTSFHLHNSCDSLEFFSFNLFPSLKTLDVSCCKNLETLRVSVSEDTPSLFASLRSLCISHCPKLLHFPMEGFESPNLTLLTINNCKKLTSLPEDMHHSMPNLKALRLWNCPNIEWTPDKGWLPKLTSVSIQNCKKFMKGKLEWSASNLTALSDLTRFKLPSPSPVTTEPQNSRWLPASMGNHITEPQVYRWRPHTQKLFLCYYYSQLLELLIFPNIMEDSQSQARICWHVDTPSCNC